MGYIESLKHAADYSAVKKAARMTILETIVCFFLIGVPGLLILGVNDWELSPFFLPLILQAFLIISVIRLNVLHLPQKKDLIFYGWLYVATGLASGLFILPVMGLVKIPGVQVCGYYFWIFILVFIAGYGLSRISSAYQYLSSPASIPDKESILRLKSFTEHIEESNPSTDAEIVEIKVNKAYNFYRLKPVQQHLVICRYAEFAVGVYVVPAHDFSLEVDTLRKNSSQRESVHVRFFWTFEDGRSSKKVFGTITRQHYDKFLMWHREIFKDGGKDKENNSGTGEVGDFQKEIERSK